MKLDPAGSLIWAKRFGVLTGERGGPVAVDAAGNLLLAGHYECNVLYQPPAIDFGGGTLPCNFSDMGLFVVKMDPNGNPIWSYGMPYGSNWGFRPLDIAIDTAGSALVLVSMVSAFDHAMFVRKFDASGNVLWSISPVPGSTLGTYGELAVDGAGNVLVGFEHAAGVSALCPCDYYVVIAKYDPSGAQIWKKQISAGRP
jgi:outer membrane protein assembly factor BamB